MTRRRLLQGAALGIGFPMLNLASFRLFADSPATYSARAVALVERSLVIDMLAVIKINFLPEAYANPLTEAEIAAFRSCGITGFHNAIGTGGPAVVEETLSFLAAWQGFCARNSDLFCVVDTASDLDRAKSAGKCAVMMGIQNSEHFRSAEDVKTFHQLGQRCSQLTYNSQNLLGSGSTDRVDGGVSDYGAEIIAAMNDVGMLVDVSHCGDRTTLDAIEISKRPIAITHSNCRALNDHPRLKTDEAITKLAARDGVMGITGVRNFVRDREPTTIEHMVDHIDHVVKLAGIEHVGIGSDSDLNGYDDMPAGPAQDADGFVQVELRLPRQARHGRLRPSEEGFRPDRGTHPPRLRRLEHRGRAGRQLPAAAGDRVGPGTGQDSRGKSSMNTHRGRNS